MPEYIVLFVLVVTMGVGLPVLSDASLIAAGTLAGGRPAERFCVRNFRVRFPVFALGAIVAGVGWTGVYVRISYFFGAEVAKRIGDAGTKAVIGALVIVAIGLSIKAGVSKWRATRQERPAGHEAP